MENKQVCEQENKILRHSHTGRKAVKKWQQD